MVCSMAPKTGRMAVVLPHGALFRSGAEGAIRRKLLEADSIEAVIGLAPNLFYGTGLAACILVIRRRKVRARKERVLIVNADKLFRKGRSQNTLLPEHIDQILGWYGSFSDVPGAVRAVPLTEIAANDYNLNIPRYIETVDETPPVRVEDAICQFDDALRAAWAAEDRLAGLLRGRGLLK